MKKHFIFCNIIILLIQLKTITLSYTQYKVVKHNKKYLNAKQLYESATSENLMLSPEGILLDDQILIEDDSPTAGYSSNTDALEILEKGIIIKKILKVDKLPVKKAFIAALLYPDFPQEPNNGRHIVFSVNKHKIMYEINHFWTEVHVPVEYLKVGYNEITLRVLEPDTRFKTWIALDENYKYGSSEFLHSPGRSLKSSNDGKSWSKKLGVNNIAVGEYSIRLKLIGYQSNGLLITKPIDLTENSNIYGIIRQPIKIESISILVKKRLFKGSSINIEFRTGSTINISDSTWTDWEKLSEKTINQNIRGGFIQLKLTFSSDFRTISPVLNGLAISCSYELIKLQNSEKVQVLSVKNYPLVNSSFSFEYENPNQKELQILREKFHLDSAVNNASSQFEKMLRLKTWVAKLWEWHLLSPTEDFMSWNANKILTPDPAGLIGGFCSHYAIVLMQALQSFGFIARYVIMDYSVWGGHEVVEAWSDDFGKWILLDPNYDTYFANPETGIPYNALELHKIFLKKYYSNSVINRNNWSRENFVRKAKKVRKNVPIICITGGGAKHGTLKKYKWWEPALELYPYSEGFGFLNCGFLRYMPRNNFLSKPFPIPINEGRTHWPWTGYYCWYDTKTPKTVEHKIYTSKESDIYWNLNQVEFFVFIKDNNCLLFEMKTNAPYFNYYEVFINAEKLISKKNFFEVRLTPGINEIKMRIVDVKNNSGSFSLLKLNLL